MMASTDSRIQKQAWQDKKQRLMDADVSALSELLQSPDMRKKRRIIMTIY